MGPQRALEEGRGSVGVGQRCFHPTNARRQAQHSAGSSSTRSAAIAGAVEAFLRPLLALADELRVGGCVAELLWIDGLLDLCRNAAYTAGGFL